MAITRLQTKSKDKAKGHNKGVEKGMKVKKRGDTQTITNTISKILPHQAQTEFDTPSSPLTTAENTPNRVCYFAILPRV